MCLWALLPEIDYDDDDAARFCTKLTYLKTKIAIV